MNVTAKAIRWVTKKTEGILFPLNTETIIFTAMVKAYVAGHREGKRSGKKECACNVFRTPKQMAEDIRKGK